MTSSSKTFQARTLTGVRWSAIDQVVTQVFQFSISVVLARMLAPNDFGLLGMVTVFVGFASLFADIGLGAALIQRENLRSEHLNAAFCVNLLAGLLLTLLFAGSGPLIAAFYDEPRLQSLTAFLALSFLFGSFGIVPRAWMTRELDFRRLAIAAWASKLISGPTAILLAFRGYGVWSLAFNTVLASLLTSAFVWLLSSWRPSLRFDKNSLLELLGFSSRLFGYQTINYWLRNADNFLIGRYLGSDALGFYSRAYAVMLMPIHMGSTLGRVMFPALSSIQKDKARVGRVYLRMCQATAFVTAPIMFGLLAVSDTFVLVVFGQRWAPMIPVLQILALLGFLQSIGTLVGNLLLSAGRSDLMLSLGIGTGILILAAMVIGLQHGIVGVALGYAIASYLAFLPQQGLALRLVGLSLGDLVGKLWPPTASAALMCVLVYALGRQLPAAWALPLHLAVQVAAGALIYGLIVHYSRMQIYLHLRELLWTRRHRFRGAN